MGILELLTVAFVVLKLCGVITWPWLHVFAPFIAAVCLYVLVIAAYAVTSLLGLYAFKQRRK